MIEAIHNMKIVAHTEEDVKAIYKIVNAVFKTYSVEEADTIIIWLENRALANCISLPVH